MYRSTFIIVPVIVALALAGCSASVATTPESGSASSSPALQGAPQQKHVPSELVLTGAGIGSLVVGQAPPVSDPAKDVLVFDSKYCKATEDEPERGLWIFNPNYELDTEATHAKVDGNGVVSRIVLRSFEAPKSAGSNVKTVFTDTGIR
ncbi:MAG: hypothetical protein ACRCSP_09790 [Rhodoglobus sp.]